MPDDRLDRQLRFILEIDKLKRVLRRSILIDGARRENSAEHSWHIAVIAMLLAEHANRRVDLLHVLKMLLIHDIVEVDAGDTYAYGNISQEEQHAREQQAAVRLFGLLPADQAADLRALWEEFEANITPEAQFANAVDRFMPLLHNYYTQGRSWHEHGVTLDRVIARVSPIGDGSASLWAYAQELLDDAVAQGYLDLPANSEG